MTQSTLLTVGSTLRSLVRARAALLAPVITATLSLSSLAHAQEPSTPLTPEATPTTVAPTTVAPTTVAPTTVAPTTVAPAPVEPASPTTPVAATSVASTTPADAPASKLTLTRPGLHQGFYLRLTSGPSFMTLNGHGPYGSASLTGAGYGGMIAIGGAVAPGFVLAGTIQGSAFNAEFNGGPFENATVTANGKTHKASDRATGGFGMLGVLVDWYPEPSGGWHLGGSTGVGAIVLTNSADERDLGGVNLAGSVFGGYDWALGRKWSLGLQLVVSGATRTKMMEEDPAEKNDTRDTGYRLTPFSVGVQASVLYF
jgi:hypothetical protein